MSYGVQIIMFHGFQIIMFHLLLESILLEFDYFFFSTARIHTTKSTVKILAANTHCMYFLKIAEHCQYCNLPDPWRNVHPLAEPGAVCNMQHG
jgi:hypothetical protein